MASGTSSLATETYSEIQFQFCPTKQNQKMDFKARLDRFTLYYIYNEFEFVEPTIPLEIVLVARLLQWSGGA